MRWRARALPPAPPPAQRTHLSATPTPATLAARSLLCRAEQQQPPPPQGQQADAQQAAEPPAASSSSSGSVREVLRAADGKGQKRRQADSTDGMASMLTRRFGLAGGLAWVGFLTIGTLGEQVGGVGGVLEVVLEGCWSGTAALHAANRVLPMALAPACTARPSAPLPIPAPPGPLQIKTRLEVASEEANTRDVTDATEVTTPEGLKYIDLKIGGGSPPVPGCVRHKVHGG